MSQLVKARARAPMATGQPEASFMPGINDKPDGYGFSLRSRDDGSRLTVLISEFELRDLITRWKELAPANSFIHSLPDVSL